VKAFVTGGGLSGLSKILLQSGQAYYLWVSDQILPLLRSVPPVGISWHQMNLDITAWRLDSISVPWCSSTALQYNQNGIT
jgi:hypothetical protein